MPPIFCFFICYDGGINASADDVHLSAVGMGRLNVVYAHGDSGDAWGIDKNVENTTYSLFSFNNINVSFS